MYVYSIQCECEKKYYGETLRPVSIRLKEHADKIKRKMFDSSKLADHALENNHKIDFDNFEIVARESGWKKRKIHEAICMSAQENVISQPSFVIPRVWSGLLASEQHNEREKYKRFELRKNKKEVGDNGGSGRPRAPSQPNTVRRI